MEESQIDTKCERGYTPKPQSFIRVTAVEAKSARLSAVLAAAGKLVE